MIVADTYNNRLQIFDSKLNFLRIIGREGKGEDEFDYPLAVCMGKGEHSDLILIADRHNNRVQVMTMEGVFVHSFPCPSTQTPCGDGQGDRKSVV